MPVGRTRKGKSTAAVARHSIATLVVSDEDGNASECAESTMEIVNAAYNSQQQQQHSNEAKCPSNHHSHCSEDDEDDQNQNDANCMRLNRLDLKLCKGEDIKCK